MRNRIVGSKTLPPTFEMRNHTQRKAKPKLGKIVFKYDSLMRETSCMEELKTNIERFLTPQPYCTHPECMKIKANFHLAMAIFTDKKTGKNIIILSEDELEV